MNSLDPWDRINRQISRQVNPQTFPGAAFAVETAADGKLVGSVGQGWSENTICEIGSMSKVFTATATLIALEEHGLLNPDAFVHTLPGMETWHNLPATDRRKQIKIKHLLQHTSGLPWFQQVPPALPCRGGSLTTGGTVPWTGSPGLTNECMLVDGQWQRARQVGIFKSSAYVMQTYAPSNSFAIGRDYQYSNFDYLIAARIVESLTQTSLNRYLKQKLFTPLAMKDSFFIAQKTGNPDIDAKLDEGVTDEQRGRIADVKVITQNGQFPEEVAQGPNGGWDKFRKGWLLVWPEGGMYSTTDDLMTFLRTLRDGGTHQGACVLSQNIVRLLMTDPEGVGRTMGFAYHSQDTPHGQSKGTLDHLGRFMTYFWFDSRAGNPVLGVFLSQRLTNVVVNSNVQDGTAIINFYLKLIYEELLVSGQTASADTPNLLAGSVLEF